METESDVKNHLSIDSGAPLQTASPEENLEFPSGDQVALTTQLARQSPKFPRGWK